MESNIMENRRERCIRKYNTPRAEIKKGKYFHSGLIEKNIADYLLKKYLKKGEDFYFKSKQLPFPEISTQKAGKVLSRLANTNIVIRYNNKYTILWRTNFSLALKKVNQ